MGRTARQRRFTVAEYLELEHEADERHEYQDGEILAMADGSPEQSFIIANFVREAGNALKGKPAAWPRAIFASAFLKSRATCIPTSR